MSVSFYFVATIVKCESKKKSYDFAFNATVDISELFCNVSVGFQMFINIFPSVKMFLLQNIIPEELSLIYENGCVVCRYL